VISHVHKQKKDLESFLIFSANFFSKLSLAFFNNCAIIANYSNTTEGSYQKEYSVKSGRLNRYVIFITIKNRQKTERLID